LNKPLEIKAVHSSWNVQ